MELLLFGIALAVGLYGYIDYAYKIPGGSLRPRAATWLVWGVLSTVVAFIQIDNGAGLGSIGAILGALSGYVLAAMAWKYGHRHIHEADIISIVLSVSAFAVWGIYGDKAAVIMASGIYLVGFLPTLVRATKAPRHERLTPFVTAVVKHSISYVLLGSVSVETAVFPIILTIANGLFVLYVLIGRASKRT
jgi:hypothetical protein